MHGKSQLICVLPLVGLACTMARAGLANHKLQRDSVESLNFLCPSVDSSVGLCPATDASVNEDGEEKATIFTPSLTL